ncbi:acetyl-CoA acetyltransferase [Mangrovactinospora gilvigrisea]|uniref:Acetyl-CoA acetyltransferase n=1 Tax=Mangrovactinospora gilvigrisea TaxID=1428644 RepID=A0A1J7C0C5_9ACTN|nr:acetyl-CoA C-acetyltransferase [Mangrovactinospora gilvigrisea]OIV39177.1 acetyl-CoA acetyltransferase [Mangrovactinospora gilvigrisea]
MPAAAEDAVPAAAPPRRAAILGGNRIPFAKADGAYARAGNADMLGAALDGLVDRFGLEGAVLGEFAAGAVLKHARDWNLARETVLGSRLDRTTPAFDLQQACATGLEAAVLAANKIALGQIDSAVAGGTDTVSDAPLGVNDRLRRLLLEARRTKSTAGRAALLARLRPGHLIPEIPRNAEPRTGLSMGEHAALTARQWDIGREEQDAWAARSHRNLAAAYDDGRFENLLTPYLGLARDQILRPDTSPDKLARLKPVFGTRGPDAEHASMTAGNSTPLSDGAATVLLASDDWARERGLPVLAHLVDCRTAAVDHLSGADGLLTAPVFAVPRLLAAHGLKPDDLDLVEIHEAFASQVLATLKAWESAEFCRERLGLDEPLVLDRDRINTAGSSLATGHPFAATGARILALLATLLAERARERGTTARGLISLCAAGGLGIAVLLESRPS